MFWDKTWDIWVKRPPKQKDICESNTNQWIQRVPDETAAFEGSLLANGLTDEHSFNGSSWVDQLNSSGSPT